MNSMHRFKIICEYNIYGINKGFWKYYCIIYNKMRRSLIQDNRQSRDELIIDFKQTQD